METVIDWVVLVEQCNCSQNIFGWGFNPETLTAIGTCGATILSLFFWCNRSKKEKRNKAEQLKTQIMEIVRKIFTETLTQEKDYQTNLYDIEYNVIQFSNKIKDIALTWRKTLQKYIIEKLNPNKSDINEKIVPLQIECQNITNSLKQEIDKS